MLCAVRAVTNPIPYQLTRVFPLTSYTNYLRRTLSAPHAHSALASHALRTFAHRSTHLLRSARHSRAPRTAPRICAPHALRSTYHDRASRALTEPHSHPGTHAFLCLSFLFCCHRIVHCYVCPCQFNHTTKSHDRKHRYYLNLLPAISGI